MEISRAILARNAKKVSNNYLRGSPIRHLCSNELSPFEILYFGFMSKRFTITSRANCRGVEWEILISTPRKRCFRGCSRNFWVFLGSWACSGNSQCSSECHISRAFAGALPENILRFHEASLLSSRSSLKTLGFYGRIARQTLLRPSGLEVCVPYLKTAHFQILPKLGQRIRPVFEGWWRSSERRTQIAIFALKMVVTRSCHRHWRLQSTFWKVLYQAHCIAKSGSSCKFYGSPWENPRWSIRIRMEVWDFNTRTLVESRGFSPKEYQQISNELPDFPIPCTR